MHNTEIVSFRLYLHLDPVVRETSNQSINSAYSDRSCYRPCTLNYNLEPDVDPSQCTASLGDISSLEEDENCQSKNQTPTVSDAAADVQTSQCRQNSNYQTSQVFSSAWTSHLCFGWRWRTLVLPYVILLLLLFQYLS